MPERAALITSIILERPLCLDCIATRANATLNQIEDSFQRIGRVLVLTRHRGERCLACGIEDIVVFSIERLPGG